MTSLMLFLLGAINIPFAISGKNKWLNLASWISCGVAWIIALMLL